MKSETTIRNDVIEKYKKAYGENWRSYITRINQEVAYALNSRRRRWGASARRTQQIRQLGGASVIAPSEIERRRH